MAQVATLCSILEPLNEVIYNRFGLNWTSSEGVYTSTDGASTAIDSPRWNQVLRTLAEELSAPPSVPDVYKAPIVDFVTAMVSGQSPPGRLWDLSDSNRYALGSSPCLHDVFIRMSQEQRFFISLNLGTVRLHPTHHGPL